MRPCLLAFLHLSLYVHCMPTIPSRLYIDMNTLDAPDVSYILPSHELNVTRVQEALAPLLALAPTLTQAGFTGVVVEVTGIEDFLSYDKLGSGTEVYPEGDPHRGRAVAWGSTLGPVLSSLSQQGLDPYLMAFDLIHPPTLAQHYNLTLRSPDLKAVLVARFTELFLRLPALRGLLMYVADCWSPRGGYVFQQLWSSLDDLAFTATLYYEAFTLAAPPGAELLFSLWTPPSEDTTPAQAWAILRAATPLNMTFALHDSQGDFSVVSPMNALLAAGAARDRRVYVGSDAFRQVDGWGRLLVSPAQQWAQRLAFSAASGAVGGMVYSDWSPGITWPDSGPSLQNWTAAKGPISWRSWGRFKTFGLRQLGLFSPAEANVAVLAGLYAAPQSDPWVLLRAWAEQPPLALSPQASALLAAAYNASMDGWTAKYMPGVDRYAIEWQSVFTPKSGANAESSGEGLLSLFANASLAQIDLANAAVQDGFSRALGLVEQALQANGTAIACGSSGGEFHSPLPLPLPLLSNDEVEGGAGQLGSVGAALLLAAQKTRETGALFCNFRVAVWLNNSLGSGAIPLSQACTRQGEELGALRSHLSTFASLYPEESVRWNLGAPDPALDARPVFFEGSPRCMRDWLELFESTLGKSCSGGTTPFLTEYLEGRSSHL